MAETEGFEPSIGLQTLYSLSRGAPSATRPHLQKGAILTRLTQLLSVTRINRSTIAKARTGSEPTSLSRVRLNRPLKTQMRPHFD